MKITLKALRYNSHLTQSEAAEMIGVAESTWHNWENVKTFPNIKYIIKIENTFNVNYDCIEFLPSYTV